MKRELVKPRRTVERHPFAFFRPVDEQQSKEIENRVKARLDTVGSVSVRAAGLERPMAYSVITSQETRRIEPIQQFDVDDLTEALWSQVIQLQSARQSVPVKEVRTLSDRNEGQRIAIMLGDDTLCQERQAVIETIARQAREPLHILHEPLLPEDFEPHITVVRLDPSASDNDWRQAWVSVSAAAPSAIDLNQASLYRVGE